jgi:hypothetical protein
LKWRAFDDGLNDRSQPVVALPSLPHDAPNDRHIGWFDAPAQSIGHYALGQDRGESIRSAQDGIAQRNRSVDFRTVGQDAGGIDWSAILGLLTPLTD